MDGDTGDHDNLFHIGGSGEEDEREGGQEGTIKREELQAKHSVVKALPEAFSTQEEGMGNDPYNLDDWDVLNTGERDNDELLYYGFSDHGSEEEYDYENDADSLMDHGLEEVEDILREKGRLSAINPTQRRTSAGNRDWEVYGSGHSDRIGKVTQEVNIQNDSKPVLHRRSARGTGAQAATILKTDTAPTGGGVLTSESPGTPTQSATALQKTRNTHAHAPKNNEVRYSLTRGTGVYSPTRRQQKPPFIQAKDLTLTYAQAKLFGLVISGGRPVTLAKVLKATKSANCDSQRYARDRGQNNHTFSPSRMEYLASPAPRKGRACTEGVFDRQRGPGQGERGKGDVASFTWKRSKKAEAAMRNPACGYDFVRESGYQKGAFLGRVAAYSSHSRAKLETRRACEAYAARLDKLECPECQNSQSYDERLTKKSVCPNCEVAYCLAKTWNRKAWEQRNEICASKSQERQARMERAEAEKFIRNIPRQTRHAALLRNRVGQVDFIRRMLRDLRKRRAREENQPGGGLRQQFPPTDSASTRTMRPASAPIGGRMPDAWHRAMGVRGENQEEARGVEQQPTASTKAAAVAVAATEKASQKKKDGLILVKTAYGKGTRARPAVLLHSDASSSKLLTTKLQGTTLTKRDSRSTRGVTSRTSDYPRPASAKLHR